MGLSSSSSFSSSSSRSRRRRRSDSQNREQGCHESEDGQQFRDDDELASVLNDKLASIVEGVCAHKQQPYCNKDNVAAGNILPRDTIVSTNARTKDEQRKAEKDRSDEFFLQYTHIERAAIRIQQNFRQRKQQMPAIQGDDNALKCCSGGSNSGGFDIDPMFRDSVTSNAGAGGFTSSPSGLKAMAGQAAGSASSSVGAGASAGLSAGAASATVTGVVTAAIAATVAGAIVTTVAVTSAVATSENAPGIIFTPDVNQIISRCGLVSPESRIGMFGMLFEGFSRPLNGRESALLEDIVFDAYNNLTVGEHVGPVGKCLDPLSREMQVVKIINQANVPLVEGLQGSSFLEIVFETMIICDGCLASRPLFKTEKGQKSETALDKDNYDSQNPTRRLRGTLVERQLEEETKLLLDQLSDDISTFDDVSGADFFHRLILKVIVATEELSEIEELPKGFVKVAQAYVKATPIEEDVSLGVPPQDSDMGSTGGSSGSDGDSSDGGNSLGNRIVASEYVLFVEIKYQKQAHGGKAAFSFTYMEEETGGAVTEVLVTDPTDPLSVLIQSTPFPTFQPSQGPTTSPDVNPTTAFSSQPTAIQSESPIQSPSEVPSFISVSIPSTPPPPSPPSQKATTSPNVNPTPALSSQPTAIRTESPKESLNESPSNLPNGPSETPSSIPSSIWSESPSAAQPPEPYQIPNVIPSENPGSISSTKPSIIPSTVLSLLPSFVPSVMPSMIPSPIPNTVPSTIPSIIPSMKPTSKTSDSPSVNPISEPSRSPTLVPSAAPSRSPTTVPSSTSTSASSANPTNAYEWRFEIWLLHDNNNSEDTQDDVTFSFYSGGSLKDSTFFNGVTGANLTTTVHTQEDLDEVIVSINGDDAMFIDYAELQKDGVSIKRWGGDEGAGWCLSMDSSYSFDRQSGHCAASKIFAV
ncbi:unnamed protein product [Cylindrotheca closterium]|uniref:Circumsporozoite protein n=1 Tax=Cylindrotheca closterium TaxID=2856 RepID=A0AAD2CX65_9STRA|nr:unnamed protein product [Cylindrotheca closterium]